MMEFFNQLEPALKIYWVIATVATLIFIIQSILTFTGTDAADGVAADFEGDLTGGDSPFQLFSFRNLINFLLGFGWSGIAFYNTITNKTLLMLIAFGIGIIFLFLFFIIIQQLQKLAEDNSFKIKDTLHKTATVYITIPANKTGKGKVQVSVKGSIHELEAVTHGNSIASGTMVKIIEIIDNNLLVVEKI